MSPPASPTSRVTKRAASPRSPDAPATGTSPRAAGSAAVSVKEKPHKVDLAESVEKAFEELEADLLGGSSEEETKEAHKPKKLEGKVSVSTPVVSVGVSLETTKAKSVPDQKSIGSAKADLDKDLDDLLNMDILSLPTPPKKVSERSVGTNASTNVYNVIKEMESQFESPKKPVVVPSSTPIKKPIVAISSQDFVPYVPTIAEMEEMMNSQLSKMKGSKAVDVSDINLATYLKDTLDAIEKICAQKDRKVIWCFDVLNKKNRLNLLCLLLSLKLLLKKC